MGRSRRARSAPLPFLRVLALGSIRTCQRSCFAASLGGAGTHFGVPALRRAQGHHSRRSGAPVPPRGYTLGFPCTSRSGGTPLTDCRPAIPSRSAPTAVRWVGSPGGDWLQRSANVVKSVRSLTQNLPVLTFLYTIENRTKTIDRYGTLKQHGRAAAPGIHHPMWNAPLHELSGGQLL